MATEDDVLEPFVDEWQERQAAIAAALDRLLSTNRAPRIERTTDKSGQDHYTLIRRDGEEARARWGDEARAVTARFTPDEWAMIERVVLLRHGLAPAEIQEETNA